jgi:glutamine phosphoribosylpyrophosphate amidotransferase
MCGIAAISPARPGNLTGATRAALISLTNRGPMAGGIAWTDAAHGEVYYEKRQGNPARNVATGQWRIQVPRHSRAVIIHTRYATQGSPSVEANNHPITVPGIVLVHNGTIANDAEVFTQLRLPRTAEVDSEAIAAALGAIDPDGATHCPRNVDEALSLPIGRNACIWLTPGDRPEVVHAARVSDSPLCLAQLKDGTAMLASTWQAIDAMAHAWGSATTYEEAVPEGQYLTLARGRVATWQPLRLAHRTISLTERRRLAEAGDQATHGGR